MSKPTQSFENHAAYQPSWHYVAFPAAFFYFVWTVIVLVRGGVSADALLHCVLAIGVVATVWASRIMVLTVQDRIIRLEMRLRLREVLPAPLAARIPELTKGQLIGLRFASDTELPGLVERVLRGELVRARDVKAAVKEWQADHLRA
jgi:Family of unknown function (DUF6526)